MLNFTNYTPIKKTLPCSLLLLQELEAQEVIRLEELLQAIDTLEDSFQDLPSIDDYLADIKQLTDRMEKDLEEYLNG